MRNPLRRAPAWFLSGVFVAGVYIFVSRFGWLGLGISLAAAGAGMALGAIQQGRDDA